MGRYRILLIILLVLFMQVTNAGDDQYTDEKGKVQFSEQPPPSRPGTHTSRLASTGSQIPPGNIILGLRKLLEEKKFTALNNELSRFQLAFESAISAEENVFTAYDAFEIRSEAYESLFNEWVASSPNHYIPYLARARYYSGMGWASRGGQWASETKQAQFDQMDAYFAKAKRDIAKVTTLNKKTILPYHILIGIANAQGEDGCQASLVPVENNDKLEELVAAFQSKYKPKRDECVFLIIRIANDPNMYTIAGFDDGLVFRRENINDPNHPVSVELNVKPVNKNKVINYVTSALGITKQVDMQAEALQQGLVISPGSYRLRTRYLWAISPKWGGSFEEMQVFIDEALKSVSVNPKLKLLSGYIYTVAGDVQSSDRKYSVAEDYYNKALTFGENPDTLKERGENRYRRGDYINAMKDLNRAIALKPESGDFYYWRSKVHSKQEDYIKAASDLERASQFSPFKKKIASQRDWLTKQLVFLGSNYSNSRKYQQALNYLDASIQLSPNHAKNYYWRAKAYIGDNQRERALVDLKKAIELEPNVFNYYQLIDWVLAKHKDWEQIIEYWDQYIQLVPDDGRAYVERGGAYYHKGDMKSAVANAKKSADLGDPEGKEAYEKFKHLVR